MHRRFVTAAVTAAALAGCTAVQPDTPAASDPLAAFADFTIADLEAARADAAAHGEAIAAACYAALKDFVATVRERPGGTVKGAFSAYQRVRDLHRGVEGGAARGRARRLRPPGGRRREGGPAPRPDRGGQARGAVTAGPPPAHIAHGLATVPGPTGVRCRGSSHRLHIKKGEEGARPCAIHSPSRSACSRRP